MVKKLLVAVAIAAPLVLMSVADQARLAAQLGTSVVINEFRAPTGRAGQPPHRRAWRDGRG
jgi:hypothetical protein